METNRIVDELRARASLDLNPEQKAWFEQQANDARPVECVRMRDVFTPEQLQFLFKNTGYKTQQKMCYRNAAELVERAEWMAAHFDSGVPEIKYVEGYAYCYGLLPIEHAFVKVGDLYIDPTFERALHRDVSKEMYASCIELDPETMARYQLETGFYGELYVYDYMCKNRPELAEQIRARNPHNRWWMQKPRPDESRRGGQNTVVGDTMVKRRHKDRENSAIGEIPYFFLLCWGFSRYPDA